MQSGIEVNGLLYNLPTGIWALIQARMGSVRLPNKTMADIEGSPMLERVVNRVKLCNLFQGIMVVTTELPGDKPIVDLANKLGIACYQGSERDVLDRYYRAASLIKARTIVRITADCPLIDWHIIAGAIQFFMLGEYDYVTNRPTYPDGMDVEVMTFGTLRKVKQLAGTPDDREHVTSYILEHPTQFHIGRMDYDIDLSHIKLSVDTQEDLDRVRQIYRELGEYCGLDDIVNWLGVRQ